MINKSRRAIISFIIGISLALFSKTLWAQTGGTDAIQMLINLSNVYPAVTMMLTAFCYLSGFALIVKGVFQLKLYGELRTMMSTQTSLRLPLTLIFVGSALIFIPTTYRIVSTTMFGYASPLDWGPSSTDMLNPIAMKAVTGIVQIIGLISFIKGWMILVAHAQQPGGQATLGKAATHIIGGLCAYNIVGFTKIIWTTFGF